MVLNGTYFSYLQKTTNLPQVIDKLYHIIPSHERDFNFTTLVVIRTDCIASAKSNYHINTITTPTPSSHSNLCLRKDKNLHLHMIINVSKLELRKSTQDIYSNLV